MRTPLVLVLLLLAPLAWAADSPQSEAKYDDIVELSPDLYLLFYTARVETYVRLRMDAIERANAFAASKGGVAVPITGRFDNLSLTLKLYEYQFRVMSREAALAARPVLADAVITVNNTGQCAPNAAIASVLPDLHGIAALNRLDVLGRLPKVAELSMSSSPAPSPDAGPGTFCMPGQICQPAQQCLPGWECSPGMPPSMEPPKPVTPPPG